MESIYSDKKIKHDLRLNEFLNCCDRNIQKLCLKRTDKSEALKSLRNKYFMKSLPDIKQSQNFIRQLIDKDKPFAVIRFGLYEYILCRQFLEIQNHLRNKYSEFICYHINIDAGMFTNDSVNMDMYAKNIIDGISKADVIAYWRNYPEKLVFDRFLGKNTKHIPVESLYPYPFWHSEVLPSWQMKLKGKRVLVVSSFSKSVEKQYTNREKIWGEKTDIIIPKFNLISFQTVQTCGGAENKKYACWKEALDDMLMRILDINFDIALISCGSYGIPLALELKKAGKKAIQWGGCFQLWFGILGKRWDTDKAIAPYINEAWIYPDVSEMPPMAELVDGGSYWGDWQ